MAFITRDQINRYQKGLSITNESISLKQAAATASSGSTASTSIFLSHSHKDKELIAPALAFLRSHGVTIYVDWMDEGMPDTVSSATAVKIKEKIKQQKKFVLMVTENSKDSRWVPWELGYADPVKGINHIATFPIAERTDFTKNEYMKIYPKIEYVSDMWWVWTDDPQKLVKLDTWLRS